MLKFVLVAASAFLLVQGDLGKSVTDPVSQKPLIVAKDTPSVGVNGSKLYFADAKSRETFLKTPETYLKTPPECPVKGLKRPPNKANRLVVNDEILYFCCSECPQAFKKEPASFLPMLKDPVSGKEFSLAADSPASTFKGGLYYFQSAGNKEAFDKEPGKFAKTILP